MRRLFIATKYQMSEAYMALLNELKRVMCYDHVVWVNTPLQHITWRFLGKTDEQKIQPLSEMLSEIAQKTFTFSLEMNKLGVFGSSYAPRVIWLGFEQFEKYQQLFNTMEDELLSMGMQANYGNTIPHLTLGRIKKIDNKKIFWSWVEEHKKIKPQQVIFKEITLFQSFLKPQGPIYKPIKTVTFLS